MGAAAAALRRVSHAANAPPVPTNSSRRLIPLIIRSVIVLARVRQPVHVVPHLPGDVVEVVSRTARQHRNAAVLRRHDDAGHSRLVEAAARAQLLVAQDENRGGAARGLYHQVRHVMTAGTAGPRVTDPVPGGVAGGPG